MYLFHDLMNCDLVISTNPDIWESYFSVLRYHCLVDESAVTGMRTAMLFSYGGSQAARIPIVFRFDSDSVYLFQEDMTGDIILSGKPIGWNDFFQAG